MWLSFVLLAVVLAAVGAQGNCRLGFESDKAIAGRVRNELAGAMSRDEVRSALQRHFKLLGEGQGRGPFLSREAFHGDNYYFHVVIGQYRALPYRTTVESFVVLGSDGAAPEVFVRRTTDGL